MKFEVSLRCWLGRRGKQDDHRHKGSVRSARDSETWICGLCMSGAVYSVLVSSASELREVTSCSAGTPPGLFLLGARVAQSSLG